MKVKETSHTSSTSYVLSDGKWRQLLNITKPIIVETLDLSQNLLSSNDIPSFPTLPRLQKADLSKNSLDSSLDLGVLFEKFPQLRVFFMKDNKLTGEWRIKITGAGGNIFTAQKYIPLQHLDLSHNMLKTLVFESELPLLQVLDVSENRLECLGGLENVKYLNKLNVSYNKLGHLSREISALQLLQDLDGSHNAISRFCLGKQDIELSSEGSSR